MTGKPFLGRDPDPYARTSALPWSQWVTEVGLPKWMNTTRKVLRLVDSQHIGSSYCNDALLWFLDSRSAGTGRVRHIRDAH